MLCYGSLSKWIQGTMEIHHQVLLIPKARLALSLYHGKDQPVMWESRTGVQCVIWNVIKCGRRDWWARLKARKGLLNEVSVLLIRGTWERCRWAKGKEEGIPGHKAAYFVGTQNHHPAVWVDVWPAELACGHSTKECWPWLRMRRRSVNQESPFWTASSPEAPEDDQEQRSRQFLILIKRQRVWEGGTRKH